MLEHAVPNNHGIDMVPDVLQFDIRLSPLPSPPRSRARKLRRQAQEEAASLPPAGGSRGELEFRPEGPRGGAMEAKHGATTRIVTVAGLVCPCGGTHVSSTGQLGGVRVTRVKPKKGTLRVSYNLFA